MNKASIIVIAIVVIAVHAVLLFLTFQSDTPSEEKIRDEIAGSGSTSQGAEQEMLPAVQQNRQEAPSLQQPQAEKEASVKEEKSVENTSPVKEKTPEVKTSSPSQPQKTQKETVEQQAPPPHPVLPPQKNKPLPKQRYSGKPSLPSAQGAISGSIPIKAPKLHDLTMKKLTGVLVDLDKNKVLWQFRQDKAVQIASLTKMMTLMLAYEKLIATPKADMKEEIPISRESRGVPPSGVAFKPDETSFPLDKLMLAAAVKSANDAAFLIAQHFGDGKVGNYIKDMNSRAQELGMTHTKFYNPHGLPEGKGKNNTSSVMDLVLLCKAYLTYPQLHEWSGMRTGNFRVPGDLVSSNHLLRGGKIPCRGVTGIKTGFTNGAGFCIATLCERNGRTMLLIITGFISSRERDEFARAMFDWGFKR